MASSITRWISTSMECGRGSALGNALTLLRWVALVVVFFRVFPDAFHLLLRHSFYSHGGGLQLFR